MTILIDATCVTDKITGVSRYSIELLKNLLLLDKNNNYKILINKRVTNNHILYTLEEKNKNLSLITVNIPAIGIVREIKFCMLLKKLEYDIFHCMSSNLPLCIKKNAIVTIHDLKFILYPAFLGKLNFIKSLYLKKSIKAAIKNAKSIITVSENTKKDLIKIFPKFKDTIIKKTNVIYEAANLDKTLYPEIVEQYNLKRDYILYIGELRPHKNISGLIKAYNYLINKYKLKNRLDLIIIGKYHKTFIKELAKQNLSGVRFVGYIEDKYLYTFYKNAKLFCLVSFYEGFGIPILEAMDSGTPVITSNISSMTEIAKDSALIVDPNSIKDISSGMYSILTNKKQRDSLIAKGKVLVKTFSWKVTAEKTLNLYLKMIKENTK